MNPAILMVEALVREYADDKRPDGVCAAVGSVVERACEFLVMAGRLCKLGHIVAVEPSINSNDFVPWRSLSSYAWVT